MVDIVGRAKAIVETVVDEQQAKQAGKKAGEAAADGMDDAGAKGGSKFSQGFEGIVGKSLPLAAVGVGAAVGTVLAGAIAQNLQRDNTAHKFVASLGLDGKEAAELNAAASEIYKDNWGESFEAVQRGVTATKSSFRELDGKELLKASEAAQIFADIFETDVVEAAGVASVAVKNGLAKDAVEAFDLMTAAAQQVPIQFRGELLEAVTEYSQFFHQIGIDGPEAFKLLAEGAALGQYGIDKTGDAIKEFGIRVIDSSATTLDAFKVLGLNIETIQDQIAAGGQKGEEAFRLIVTALDSIQDPSEKARVAIELFGTPVEDLGNEKIPAFVDALARGTEGLDDFKGKTQEAGDTASDTFTSKAAGWGRSLDVYLGLALTGISKKLEAQKEGFDKWADKVHDATHDVIVDFGAVNDALGDVSDTIAGLGLDSGFISDITGSGHAVGGPAAGWTLVGERGPEIVNLPNGSYVHNNNDTQQMLGGGTTNVFNISTLGISDSLLQELDWWGRFKAPQAVAVNG